MARRLIMDTGVLIAAERFRLTLRAAIAEDDDVVLAAVTVAELRAGIELADTRHRERRSEFVAQLLETIPIEPYSLATAGEHGRLLAHVQRTGTRRGAHDLIIAATAAATRRTIITSDRAARFGDLPGIDCVILE